MNYKNIYQSLKKLIIEAALDASYNKLEDTEIKKYANQIAIEIPKEKSHGELSTNAAMVIAGIKRQQSKNISPKEMAENIVSKLSLLSYIDKISIAGPGFINFTFKPAFWQNVLKGIIDAGKDYGKTTNLQTPNPENINTKEEKVNIEFVSANPTGPMHIGHSRGAIYGDVLSRVMEYSGYDVVKEYYVNDAGSQIDTLISSAHLRYREAFGEEITIPAGYYPGEYLKPLALEIREQFGDKFKNLDDKSYSEFKNIVIQYMISLIKKDLGNLAVHHDVFFSEASLTDPKNNLIEKSINFLKSKGLVYEGRLERPKGEDDPDWEDRDQLLFKSTLFGDDQDRSLTKSDGTWTYFAGDIGYAMSKINRGYNRNIIILGADHSGYVKRIKAIYTALSEGKSSVDVTLCQMVNFIEDGKPIKMSKRAGSFTTVADVIKEVGSDILRFIMLTRKNDVILDFDLDLVKTYSKENPVFYVQYAQVRSLSVMKNAKENYPDIYSAYLNNEFDLSYIKSQIEIDLIRDLSLFPKIVYTSADTGEIHKIAYYLQNIASSFHSFWNLGKEDEEYKFITKEKEVSIARLALVEVVGEVIRIGLRLIGVKPLEKM